jgi:CRP-like cAMP-binding protein
MGDSISRSDDAVMLWQRLAGVARFEVLDRGTAIYTPEDAADELLMLRSGRVGLFLRSEEGRALTLGLVEPNHLFGLVALANESYDSYAESLGEVTVGRVSMADVDRLVADDPPLGLALLEQLCRHRAQVSLCLDELTFKSVPARLASLLLDLARKHGGPQTASVPRHSHRQLAEMINAYRETVTKVINQFRAARLLEINTSTITLLNLRRLEELAQG